MLARNWHRLPPEVALCEKIRQLRYIDNNRQYPKLHSYILSNCNLLEMNLLSVIRGHEKRKGMCAANIEKIAETIGRAKGRNICNALWNLQRLNLLYVNKIITSTFKYTWRISPWGVHVYEKRWMRKRAHRMPAKVIAEFVDFVENLKIMCS